MFASRQISAYGDPSKPFLGVRFILLGFDSVKEDKVRLKLLEGGGIDAVNYGPDCSHVIVDKLVYGDPICIAARRDGKALVTSLWVDHSFDVGIPVDHTSVMYRPLQDLNGIPGAKYLVVCLTGYQRHDRDDIMTMVALMGASFSKPLVANKVTHLICYRFEGEKYELAMKMKTIKLVNHRWLEDCLKAWELLPEADYVKSGHELEMEAEAKDSEEDTEDVALAADVVQNIVVSPRNTRVQNKTSFHHSPFKQEISRNSLYSSASKSLADVGETRKIQSTPGKEIGFQKALFSLETRDKHLDLSSTRFPEKVSSEVPSDIHHGMMVSEKVDKESLASRSSKKSPSSDVSQNARVVNKTSFLQSPFKQEILRNNLHSSESKSLADVGETSKFQSTPGKGINFQEASFSRETYNKNLDMSSAKTKIPGNISYEVPPDMHHGVMVSEKVGNVLSSASTSSKKSPVSDVSKLSSKSYSRSSPRKPTLPLRSERNENDLGGSPSLNVDKLGGSGGFGVKTPVTEKLSNLDEGRTRTLSYKRKMTFSRGSPKSPMLNHDPKPSIESELATKRTEELASGSSVARSHVLAGDISPVTVTRSSGEGASLGFIEALNLSATSDDRQECDDQELQRSVEGLENRKSLDVDVKALSPNRTNNCTRGDETHQNDPQSVEPPFSRTESGVEKVDGQTDFNWSKLEHTGSKVKPLRRKMLVKKTLGSRPSISKSSTTKHKGSINLQKSVLQNECTTPSNEAVSIEGRDSATITEKAVIVLPTGGEDCTMHDETEAPDIGPNEFDSVGKNEKSAELEAPYSRKGATYTEKQTDDKVIPIKKPVAKSAGGKKSPKAGKAVRSKKTELTESTTVESGETKMTKGKKRSLGKSSANNSKKDTREKATKEGSNSKQNKKMVVKKTLDSRPSVLKTNSSTKLKGSLNLEKAVLQSEYVTHSNGVEAMEGTDNATITEKAVIVPPTSGEDCPVDDKTEAPDEGQNEADHGCNRQKSAEHKTSLSRKRGKKSPKAEKVVCSKKIELTEPTTVESGETKIANGKKRPFGNSKANNKGTRDEETVALVGKTKGRPSKKLKGSADVEKENIPATIRQQSPSNDTEAGGRRDSQTPKKPLENSIKADQTNPDPVKAIRKLEVKDEPASFILSGHKLQRKEFQQVIKRLKGRVCRDSHHWSYQATHFIVPDPIRRTEKFFAAAASGSWILKTDYLTASNEAGKFLSEEPYEWHKKCLTEDGAINLEAPRKWRLVRERTGHGAFYGARIVIYGECIAPPLDTLKRVIKAGDGTILATSPPYTRFLQSGIDFAVVSPGMPRVDMWVQEFLRHEVPCVVADYLVEYVCKPGYPLERNVQYNTHAWAEKSLRNLVNQVEEVVEDVRTPEGNDDDDVACRVCGFRDRGEEMLICGDEHGSRGCGVGIHFDCLDPRLENVPEEDWFCADCTRKRKEETKSVSRSSNKRASSKSKN